MDIIKIDDESINTNDIISWLSELPQDGAVVTFIGKVRCTEKKTIGLYLEHYAGMTEKVLSNIIVQARQRWQLSRIAVIHRVGNIKTNEKIVFVGVSSAHRSDAFAAAEFIMDILKNEAPFWKKENTIDGNNWVEAKKSDVDALKKWY
ncbi:MULTISPECIES: molybdopterin synthase catalytic subunit MoaE [unclassified Gilliamella]|uniref:molybdopterin synthase catalytic subunit MoaE n=1 Tax=unclassified Gilliamella TaxID=2685620 RepID=UPI00226A288F|nr:MULTISPECIES: molybdopterin synthase catalytic subunit MoaE [unclassified Gilliamella]MCX8573890.1 molybdopterin synthase catalytic subunit MoaE [Gilliamella sp. B3831]MCX8576121.1 molybdopterin synthase catalytic subunit MoaE [Gilliamella sp. B3815]MCX8579952.1 molybdopterin synthase catalytic subunit MoaE [Gilliamella sp. B2717]MCX8603222.1 molybdopterin synthase catalytic subunit MoaE [Gilliamella sp. B3823]MCX8606597.1 molybdopterin synthase catalytic subunit MoaE [Gilliamella sp. B3825